MVRRACGSAASALAASRSAASAASLALAAAPLAATSAAAAASAIAAAAAAASPSAEVAMKCRCSGRESHVSRVAESLVAHVITGNLGLSYRLKSTAFEKTSRTSWEKNDADKGVSDVLEWQLVLEDRHYR